MKSLFTLALVGLPFVALAEGRSPATARTLVRGFQSHVEYCIERKDNPQSPLFHGCIDWHSAVEAYWSAFRLGRFSREGDVFARKVAEKLTPESIGAEGQRLKNDPSFELPYGRAWFLRLSTEHDRWAALEEDRPRGRLRAVADETAASLMRYFENRKIDVRSNSYTSDPWVLEQLYLYFLHYDDPRARTVHRWIVEMIESGVNLSMANDAQESGFFSSAALVSRLGALYLNPIAFGEFWAKVRSGVLGHRPIDATAGHRLGVNWTRARAFATLSLVVNDPFEKSQLREAHQTHVNHALKEFVKYKEDYANSTHWVPQFAIDALTQNLDARP